ncbi:hypothetical protein LINGRAHAP2_LOCUS25980 [Linum grandiflorum]
MTFPGNNVLKSQYFTQPSMAHRIDASKCPLIWLPFLLLASLHSASAALCELSHADGRQIFNFGLTSPLPGFPHGILSEDGFYNVANNESVLWFQLCDGMIFNHNPPRCFGCQDCGGTSHCGTGCSALVANNIDGYDVCSSLGSISSTVTEIMDNDNPQTGVTVKISNLDSKDNCSLSVSVICDLAGLKGPSALQKLGTCTYTAILQHPSGCPTVVFVHGRGLGWFSTLIIMLVPLTFDNYITSSSYPAAPLLKRFLSTAFLLTLVAGYFSILSVFGAYMIAGAVYRHFFLGINGLDAIPNLDFWVSLPLRIQGYFASLVRRFKGPTETYRSFYSPVNF